MKNIRIRFEPDSALSGIEITVRASEQDAEVAALMERIAGESGHTLTVLDGRGNLKTLAESEIILASVDGKSVRILTADGCWLSRRTLQSLEEQLDSRCFVRISRYEIVNLRKVARYDFTISGTLRLELEGGMETWASRRCIPEIRRRLKGKEASAC
ncbi:MAG: LytTR family transcriptional regulator [Oscillospiraceae bacterium]|nr:LytTR family transcriptional regulator [Oscillospiraceae bacterium]